MSTRVIKDSECSAGSPLVFGYPDTPVYGLKKAVVPRRPGKQVSDHDRKVFLPELLPLEEYDLIVVLFSGGKDSTAAYLKLLEMGVPKSKIELWHHDVDGGHPTRRMDWPVTQAYVRAFAAAEGVKLRVSCRVNGFFGELYRVGASHPIEYEDNGEIKICRLSPKQIDSERLRNEILETLPPTDQETLKGYGQRLKFPAKSGDLGRRWCSAYLKIDVATAVIRNMEELRHIGQRTKFPAKSVCSQGRWCSGRLKGEVQSGVTANLAQTRQNIKILVISGERRGESAGRANYNEMEIHRTNAAVKAHRVVHHWRAVIDHSLNDIWEMPKRHGINPHPCYACGWGRCSCMCCIFSLPSHWAGIRELFPKAYEAFRQDEIRLGFTLDNKKTLDEYVGDAKSCVCRDDPAALERLVTGRFPQSEIYTTNWCFPAGAFKGSAGGPC
jgi:3'-phosphoadenosine 5'-phosphosulfate sulfotransferase (PAPS reductase)/FAD synthetase